MMTIELDKMMEDDAFLQMPEFQNFDGALEGVPEVVTTAMNTEYHRDAARKFKKRYQITFEQHVFRNWDDSSKTHYLRAATQSMCMHWPGFSKTATMN
jgi:hypothetical protein